MTHRERIRGIIPAMVTPLDPDGRSVNEASLRRLVEHLIAGGVHGLFATGSQGEFYALTDDERLRVWQVTLDQVAGRLPVYVGTGAVYTQDAVRLARLAERVGADAISVITPYFIAPSQAELYEHYRAIAEAVSLPVLLYTNPGRTGVNLSVDTVARLAEIPNIAGIKDSSGDMALMGEYIRCCPPGFAVLAGRDTLIYGALCYGAVGAIAATANVAPALVCRIYECFLAGDLAGAAEAQRRLAPLRQAFGLGSFPVVIKEALDMMGFEAGPARLPISPLNAAQRIELRRVLEGLHLLPEG